MKIMLKIRSGKPRHMKSVNDVISTCRHCQFYRSEGRRGGYCQQLTVPVQSGWKSCSLATAPFASNWKKLAGVNSWAASNSDLQSPLVAELSLQNMALSEGEPVAIPVLANEEVFLLSD